MLVNWKEPLASGWVVRSGPRGPWMVLRLIWAAATWGPALTVPLMTERPPLPPAGPPPPDTVSSTDACSLLLEPVAVRVSLPDGRSLGRPTSARKAPAPLVCALPMLLGAPPGAATCRSMNSLTPKPAPVIERSEPGATLELFTWRLGGCLAPWVAAGLGVAVGLVTGVAVRGGGAPCWAICTALKALRRPQPEWSSQPGSPTSSEESSRI